MVQNLKALLVVMASKVFQVMRGANESNTTVVCMCVFVFVFVS